MWPLRHVFPLFLNDFDIVRKKNLCGLHPFVHFLKRFKKLCFRINTDKHRVQIWSILVYVYSKRGLYKEWMCPIIRNLKKKIMH